MNILEAIHILNNKNYIVESNTLNPLANKILGINYEHNKVAFNNNGRDNAPIKDSLRYNDHEGIIWTYITKRDDTTLKLAFIDGYIDANYAINTELGKKYREITTKEDLDNFLNNYTNLKNKLNDSLNFIKKYMKSSQNANEASRGIKVYRGLSIKREEWLELIKNKHIKNAQDIIDIIDNTNKQFNSFSVDPDVSKLFACGWAKDENSIYITDNIIIVFSGYAEPNDIYYAFTMYLFGRHGGSSNEFELNINNRQKLKNVKIELYRNPFELEKKYNNLVNNFKKYTIKSISPNNINISLNIVFDNNGNAGIQTSGNFKLTDICKVIGNKEYGILVPNDSNACYYIIYNIYAGRSIIVKVDDLIDLNEVSKSKIKKIGKDYLFEIYYDGIKDAYLFDDDEYMFFYYNQLLQNEKPALIIGDDEKYLVTCKGAHNYGECMIYRMNGHKFKAFVTAKTKYGPVINGGYGQNPIDKFELENNDLEELDYREEYCELEPYTVYKTRQEYTDFSSNMYNICMILDKK